MKILQVVTVLTPDNAYGGPLRVAANQTRELRARGHDVTLVSGCQGFEGELPEKFDGVEISLFKAANICARLGFAGTVSPGLFWFIIRYAKKFDLIHFHFARDLVVVPAALVALFYKMPFFLQTHGMIDESSSSLASIIDSIAVRRCMRAAKAVFWLTDVEHDSLVQLFGSDVRMRALVNGVPQVDSYEPQHLCDATPPMVLFLARMHLRKRPLIFAQAAKALIDEGVPGKFVLVGPDEGQGQLVSECIESAGERITWVGGAAPTETGQFMREASIYCLPSVDEPFPMSVLEALAHGLPVIVTESCGLAEYIRQYDAGVIVDEREESFTLALRKMLTDPVGRKWMSENAIRLSREKFSMRLVVDNLIRTYSI